MKAELEGLPEVSICINGPNESIMNNPSSDQIHFTLHHSVQMPHSNLILNSATTSTYSTENNNNSNNNSNNSNTSNSTPNPNSSSSSIDNILDKIKEKICFNPPLETFALCRYSIPSIKEPPIRSFFQMIVFKLIKNKKKKIFYKFLIRKTNKKKN